MRPDPLPQSFADISCADCSRLVCGTLLPGETRRCHQCQERHDSWEAIQEAREAIVALRTLCGRHELRRLVPETDREYLFIAEGILRSYKGGLEREAGL